MRQRRPAPLRPNLLHLAQDNLETVDQVTVFGGLFDAAIRATWTMGLGDPRRKAVLNEALDMVYKELKRETPAQVRHAPVATQRYTGAAKVKYPALRP